MSASDHPVLLGAALDGPVGRTPATVTHVEGGRRCRRAAVTSPSRRRLLGDGAGAIRLLRPADPTFPAIGQNRSVHERAPFPVTVLGRVATRYDQAANPRPLSGAQQATLAMLVAGGDDGTAASDFAGWSSGERSVEALRMSMTRLREHLPPGAVPEGTGGRYRLALSSDDVDLWYLRDLARSPLPALLDPPRVRHLVRPVAPFGVLSGEPALADAVDEARRLQRDLLARLASERPELVRTDLVGDLLAHVGVDPYDERLVLACATTLARSGDRRGALNVVAEARRSFVHHGLPIAADLADLERSLLDGTFALDPEPPPPPAPAELPRALADQLAAPFAGPGMHLAAMRAALDGAGGGPHAVVVQGPSGVGKTRACAELAAEARDRGFRVLHLAPVRQAGSALGPLLGALPALRDRATRIFERDDDLESRRAALWTACCEVLDDEAGTAPLLVVADDAQWLDSYTGGFLVHWAGQRGRGRGVLVVAGRDDASGSGNWGKLVDTLVAVGAVEVVVDPLDRPAIEQIVRSRRPRLGEGQVRGVAVEVHALSGGLPGIATPLVDALDEDTSSLPSAGRVRAGRELHATVRWLGADARTVGGVGAIAGPRFDLDLVEAISGLPPDRVLAAVDELVRRGLVVECSISEFTMAHVLVQAAFVESETRSRVAAWHRAAAAVFVDDVHRHAFHAAEAVPLVPTTDAVAALVRSATAHLAVGEHRAAVAAFRRAEELAGPLPPATAGDFARALDLSGSAPAARRVRDDAFERALSASDPAAALRIATSGLPEAEPVDGDTAIVEHLLRIEPASLADPDDRWAHAHHLARQLAIVGRLDEAAEVAATLPLLARTPEQRVDSAVCGRFVISATSPPGARLAVLAGAARDLASVSGPRAAGYHLVLAIDRYESGDVDAALRALEAITVEDDRIPAWRRWHASLFRAMVDTDRGHTGAARLGRDAAFDLAVRSGLTEGHNALLVAEFVDLWLRGRVTELRGAVAQGTLDPARSIVTRAGTAVVLAATGAQDRAARQAAEVVREVDRSPVSQGLAALALVSEVLAASGDAAACDRARRRLEARGDSMIVVGAGAACLGPAQRYVAMVTRDPDARLARLVAATALADRAGLRLWQVVTRRSLLAVSGDAAVDDELHRLVDGTDLDDLLA